MLSIVGKCLARQTEKSFEWLVVAPSYIAESIDKIVGNYPFYVYVAEIWKRPGDYYNLNKAWNKAFRLASGKLIISIVDGLWFPPDTVERLFAHYQVNPKACVTTIGHQYDQEENGKPEHMVWRDPRARGDLGSFYEVGHAEMELCIASFPKQAVMDVGGVDEEFDKYAACSEKEMMARMYAAGYKTYIDQSIEYRALQHPRLSSEWDAHYEAGIPYYQQCLKEIFDGKRLKIENKMTLDYTYRGV